MKFRDLSFIGIAALVVGGLQTLSFVNKPPAMPEDIHHTTVSRDVRAQCLRCHRAETMLALERADRHPAKWRDARSDCLLCHVPAKAVKQEPAPNATRNPCGALTRRELQWLIARKPTPSGSCAMRRSPPARWTPSAMTASSAKGVAKDVKPKN